MSKFLDQKFLSHGTQLGSLGPVTQKVRDEIFSIPKIPFNYGPYDFPTPLDYFPSGKNLADFLKWCVLHLQALSFPFCHQKEVFE